MSTFWQEFQGISAFAVAVPLSNSSRNAIAKSCHRLQQKPTVAYSHPINSKDRTLEVHWAHGSGNDQKKQTKPIEIRNVTNIKPRTTTHLFSKMHKKIHLTEKLFFSWRKHMLIMPSACEYRIHSSPARFASLLPNGSSLKWGPRDQPFSYLKSTKNETLCTADEIMIIIIYYHIYQMLAGNLH